MAKAARNYLKMHHPSIYKKMYGKGGKVKKMYQEGGEIENPLSPEDREKQKYWDEQYESRVGAGYKLEALLRSPAHQYARAEVEAKTRKPDYGVKTKRPFPIDEYTKDQPYLQGVERDPRFERVGMGNPYSANRGPIGARGYQEGGQVNKAQALQGMGDVVDAKLTPGEIVLNADQQSALEQELGQPIDGLMAKIGVPGFQEGGKVEKKYTPIGDPSKLTWDYNKMSGAQKDSLVTAQEKHFESRGHPDSTEMIPAYERFISTMTPEQRERERTGGYEDYYAYKRAKEVRRKKKADALAKSGQRTRGSGKTIYRKDGGKVEKKPLNPKGMKETDPRYIHTSDYVVPRSVFYSPQSKDLKPYHKGYRTPAQIKQRDEDWLKREGGGTVTEKKKLKVLRTKSKKKKGK